MGTRRDYLRIFICACMNISWFLATPPSFAEVSEDNPQRPVNSLESNPLSNGNGLTLHGIAADGEFLIGTGTSELQGIHGSGLRGIHGSGLRGIHGSGLREADDGSSTQGIHGSGLRGIHGSGLRVIALTEGEAIQTPDGGDVTYGLPLIALGQIESISDDASLVRVLGQDIYVTDSTVLIVVESDGPQVASGPDSLSTVSANDYVAIAGEALPNGESIAAAIIRAPSAYVHGSSTAYVRGFVEEVAHDVATTSIGGLTIDFASAVNNPSILNLQNGDVVEFVGFTTEATSFFSASAGILQSSALLGIHGSGLRGIHGSGLREADDGSITQGIHGSGLRGIHGSGLRGIHGSGLRQTDVSETQGIHGSGLR